MGAKFCVKSTTFLVPEVWVNVVDVDPNLIPPTAVAVFDVFAINNPDALVLALKIKISPCPPFPIVWLPVLPPITTLLLPPVIVNGDTPLVIPAFAYVVVPAVPIALAIFSTGAVALSKRATSLNAPALFTPLNCSALVLLAWVAVVHKADTRPIS